MSAVAIIAVLVVGLLLLLLEILVVPGFGVPGVLGVLALAAGLGAAFLAYGPLWGGAATAAALVLVVAMLWWGPRSRTGKAMVLGSDQGGSRAPRERADLLGARGRATTPLRPAGVVRVADEEVDAVTGGEFVDAGAPVRVVQVEGVRVVVEAIAPEAENLAPEGAVDDDAPEGAVDTEALVAASKGEG